MPYALTIDPKSKFKDWTLDIAAQRGDIICILDIADASRINAETELVKSLKLPQRKVIEGIDVDPSHWYCRVDVWASGRLGVGGTC